MAVLEEFGVADLYTVLSQSSAVFDEHADALDSLGPAISDDAGSVAAMLFRTAVESSAGSRDVPTLTGRARKAALEAPPTDSGVAFVSFFDALGQVSVAAERVDAERFALALELTSELVSQRISTGEPGGVAAVVAAASVGALRALDQNMSLVDVLTAAADEGLDELESGVGVNSELADSGVVHPVAAAFLLMLDAFGAFASDEPMPSAPDNASAIADNRVGGSFGGLGEERTPEVLLVRCTVIAFDTDRPTGGDLWVDTCAWLESSLAELGAIDEFNVGERRCGLQLRTNDAGRAVETICEVGRPTEVEICLAGAAGSVDRPR